MKITKLQQSGCIITAENGYRLGMDIGAYTPLEELAGVTVDALLVSHLHGDHFSIPHIQKLSPQKLYLNQECIELLGDTPTTAEVVTVAVGDSVSIDSFTVRFFNVDHGPNASVRPKENFGFLIEGDGKVLYFAGDMFYPSGIDVTEHTVDYLLVPVGTHYTFGPHEAVAFASQFKHVGAVIPMHYENNPETKEVFTDLATAAGFAVAT